MRTSRTPVLLSLVVAGVLSGCAGMPSSGPVVERPDSEEATTTPGADFDPRPPQAGQGPTEIVNGFLDAMRARPIRTTVAKKFLSSTAQEAWTPEQEIITYEDASDPSGSGQVDLLLTGVNSYDARGAWTGRSASQVVHFALVSENGEWRIDDAPDALVVPETWFGEAYERVTSYRFDAAAEILVPEPVHVPSGEQYATSLVGGLLPTDQDVPAIARTFFPPDLSLLPVPVDESGVARVDLTGSQAAVDDLTKQRMLVQLIWTMRQEPRIRAVQLSLNDVEIGDNGGLTPTNLDLGSAYDPNGAQAVGDLFGLLEGRLVRGSADNLSATTGPFGTADMGLRSYAVNIAGTRVAGVSGDGRALLLADVEDPEGRAVQILSGAQRLLAPAWDHRDRMWVADARRDGAAIYLVVDSVPTLVEVPGISGERVKDLLVSRDGTRLVATVAAASGDRVISARVEHDPTGKVMRAVEPVELDTGVEVGSKIRDIAWRTPTSVMALTWVNEGLAEIRTVSVDGAPNLLAGDSVTLLGQVSSLVTSPLESVPAYATLPGAVTDLRLSERVMVLVPEGVRQLRYAG